MRFELQFSTLLLYSSTIVVAIGIRGQPRDHRGNLVHMIPDTHTRDGMINDTMRYLNDTWYCISVQKVILPAVFAKCLTSALTVVAVLHQGGRVCSKFQVPSVFAACTSFPLRFEKKIVTFLSFLLSRLGARKG